MASFKLRPLRDIVHLEILSKEERNALRPESIIALPDGAYSKDNKVCRVAAIGPQCKAQQYKVGDLVMVAKTMEVIEGRAILVKERDLLCEIDFG